MGLTAWLLLCAAWGADASVGIVAAPPADAGSARVQVIADGDALPALRSGAAGAKAVVGSGTARVSGIQPLATSGGTVRTALAFDQSGSFKRHWGDAFDLAQSFASALPASGHTAEVLTFGVGLLAHGEATDSAGLAGHLATAKNQGPTQGFTRLRNFIREAITRVNKATPLTGGLRQVVVFTDAGEESTAYTVDEVVKFARDAGVVVHVVAFVGGKGAVARRLDEVKRIAEGTGGQFIQMGSAGDPTKTMARIATAGERAFWLDLDFCDVPTSQGTRFDDALEVEVWSGGARLVSSQSVPLRQHAEGSAVQPCSTQPTPTPVVADAAPTPASADGSGLPWWWPALLALCAMLLLLIVVLMRRKKPEPEPAPTPPPPPPEPVLVEASEPEPADRGPSSPFAPVTGGWEDPLDRLPVLLLELETGPASAPRTVRVNKRTFAVGARGTADLTIDVPQVSGEHATLQLYPNGNLFVRDAGSTNGTWVDGVRVSKDRKTKVSVGQRVSFSRKVVYRVSRPERGEETPPEPPKPKRRERAKTILSPVQPRPSDPPTSREDP